MQMALRASALAGTRLPLGPFSSISIWARWALVLIASAGPSGLLLQVHATASCCALQAQDVYHL